MDEQPLTAGQPLVLMHEDDDVGTALRDLTPGERLTYRAGRRAGTVEVREAIPFGHKVALRALATGAEVRKYGAVIGRATAPIGIGEHVHVHNLAGVRGRGDLAVRDQGGEGADDAAVR